MSNARLKAPALDSILRNNFYSMMSKVNTCMVGIVVGIDDLKEGFIDVQPLGNRVIGTEEVEYSTIYYVPVVMPNTNTSAIVMPVSQGDTVLLVFSQNNIEEFKFGTKDIYTPKTPRMFSVDDAIAIVGFNISQESVWNPSNYKNQLGEDSFKIVHNIGKQEECYLELKRNGVINVKSDVEINADAPVVNAKDVHIEGVGSVKEFMLSHTHKYTDDGNLLETQIPTRI